jgi:hypothetical protein
MPYDPSKPANGAPIVSAELRDQFAALNDDLQQRALYQDVYDAITAQAAGPVNSLPPPAFVISNPPTQAEVQAVADYLNSLYVLLSRT